MACSIASTSSSSTLEDCICPICMYILIHPVTMPCQHELCMPCFKQNVEESSLLCPMCRTRIGTWARLSTKQNKLVNEKRWQEIQKLFPEKVQRRLQGIESEEDEDEVLETFHHPIVNIAQPGEIRKEYEEQLQKLQKQREVEQSKEEAESAALIEKLQEEEEERQRELERQAEEQRLKDEELARQLSQAAAETSLNEGSENNLPLQPESRSSRASSTTSNGINTLDSFLSSASSVRDTAGSSFLEHNHETRYKEDKEKNNNDHSVRTVNGFISNGSPRIKHGDTSWVESHHEQSLPSNSSLADTSNFLSQHREFVRNQFTVMSRYSDNNNKQKSATVTSNSNLVNQTVVRSDCDSTTDNDDSLSCDPKETPLIDSEFATSLVSDNSRKADNIVPKRVVGLFPPEENTVLSVDDILKTNNKGIYNRNILSDDDDDDDDDDGGDEIDGQISDNINNNNLSAPSKKAKKLRKKSVKVPSPILSPQRSIKDWFSPSAKSKKDNVTKTSKSELTPKKRSGSVKERARTTAKKVVRKNRTRSTTVSQSTRKKLISSPQKRSRKSSKSLELSDEDYQSDNVDSEKRRQKSKSIVETDLVVPSPPKRQKKQHRDLSTEKNDTEVFLNRVDKAMDVSDIEGGTTPLKESRKKNKKYDESVVTPTKTVKSKRSVSVKSKFDHSTESDENSDINLKEGRNTKKNLRKSTKPINKTMSDSEIDEDLKLALALQHQFDLEDKLARQVDRSKGSESEYLFRQKPSTSSPTKRA
ncbi:hypothetical protein SNE40_000629 [Patella caerulea]|uniref:RING-type E3 ubiquitin transferase n=1 Tax=Patella caerulea TaxID=87958 RepID=A0AAN8QA81_PATCE